jgi:hypothetical protein
VRKVILGVTQGSKNNEAVNRGFLCYHVIGTEGECRERDKGQGRGDKDKGRDKVGAMNDVYCWGNRVVYICVSAERCREMPRCHEAVLICCSGSANLLHLPLLKKIS